MLAVVIVRSLPCVKSPRLPCLALGVDPAAPDFVQYKDCLVGKNWIAQLGCEALRTRNVSFAIARAGVTGIAKGALAVILAAATFVKWADVQVPAVVAVRDSGEIMVAGAASPPPPPTANPQPSAPATASAHYSIESAFRMNALSHGRQARPSPVTRSL